MIRTTDQANKQRNHKNKTCAETVNNTEKKRNRDLFVNVVIAINKNPIVIFHC